ncbi:MAG TPA: methyl-accepting chemotaxis protein, partial [Ktedonobacteraceae bacterium]|nr:methyl-accepting chemotaxis protein [Ktedonobacteraceae bacterium]
TADALGVLADSFNYMVEELGSLVVRVKMVAHEVENSTSNILDRMTQLVENSDIQIQQVGDAAAEVERMAATSRQVAEHAQSLYTIAREARVNANSGRGAVQMTIQGMGRINQNVQATATKVNVLGERSREINNIIEVISGIAHQTNRLALDAAIQAAMAGENGKGFGAVAADIRRLAERAKEQTGIITKIVRSIRDDIGSVAVSMQDTERETSVGAELTQEAGQSLELIFSVVERQASEIENINQMATQQLQSTSSIVQIMRAVNEGNRIGSASTREASHNMERLARLVEQLRSSVEAFKIRDDQSYYMPTSQVRIESPADEAEGEMTVSGIFRTISATAQPSSPQRPEPAGGFPALRTPGPSGFLPAPPPRSPFDPPYNGYNYNGNEYSGNNGNDRNY